MKSKLNKVNTPMLCELEEALAVIEGQALEAYKNYKRAVKRVSDRDRWYAVYDALMDCYQKVAGIVYSDRLSFSLRRAAMQRITQAVDFPNK